MIIKSIKKFIEDQIWLTKKALHFLIMLAMIGALFAIIFGLYQRKYFEKDYVYIYSDIDSCQRQSIAAIKIDKIEELIDFLEGTSNNLNSETIEYVRLENKAKIIKKINNKIYYIKTVYYDEHGYMEGYMKKLFVYYKDIHDTPINHKCK